MVERLTIEELEKFETTACLIGNGCIINTGPCFPICYCCTLAC